MKVSRAASVTPVFHPTYRVVLGDIQFKVDFAGHRIGYSELFCISAHHTSYSSERAINGSYVRPKESAVN